MYNVMQLRPVGHEQRANT